MSTTVLSTDNCLCDPGCGFRSTQNVSAGIGANLDKGGVYVLSWSDDGINAWFFPRAEIPSDITKKAPTPSSWGTPDMFISPDSCDPFTYFKDLGIVVRSPVPGFSSIVALIFFLFLLSFCILSFPFTDQH
jgi:hypothetical protein